MLLQILTYLMRFSAVRNFTPIQKYPTIRIFRIKMDCILLSVLIIGILTSAQAQPSSSVLDAKLMAESGLFHGDIQEIHTAHWMLEKAIKENSNSEEAYYYIGYIEYQMAILHMTAEERGDQISTGQDSALLYLNNAIDHLKRSIDLNKKSQIGAESYALLSMTYGQKIRLQPRKGMILGIRSRRSIKRAKKINSENPRIILAEAISNFNTPSQYGGSQNAGLEGFKRAISLFTSQEDNNQLLPTWGEIEAHTWLGIAYMQAGQYQQAQDSFEKALSINPNYGWVKYSLMPQLKSVSSADRQPNIR